MSYQVAPEDCTGCTLCVDACPARSPDEPEVRAINMAEKEPLIDIERKNLEFFRNLPETLPFLLQWRLSCAY